MHSLYTYSDMRPPGSPNNFFIATKIRKLAKMLVYFSLYRRDLYKGNRTERFHM